MIYLGKFGNFVYLFSIISVFIVASSVNTLLLLALKILI